MAFIHGKSAVVTVDAVDLSTFTNNVAFNRSVDSHDTTTFGQSGHTYAPGLTDGSVTLSGIYDDGVAGAPTKLRALLGGANVTLIYRPEGVGAGKAHNSCSVQVTSYSESAPVADMISWEAELQISGSVTITDQ